MQNSRTVDTTHSWNHKDMNKEFNVSLAREMVIAEEFVARCTQ